MPFPVSFIRKIRNARKHFYDMQNERNIFFPIVTEFRSVFTLSSCMNLLRITTQEKKKRINFLFFDASVYSTFNINVCYNWNTRNKLTLIPTDSGMLQATTFSSAW